MTVTIKITNEQQRPATQSFQDFLNNYYGGKEKLIRDIQGVISKNIPGITVEDIREGCIEIQLRVKDLAALEYFWKRYNSGELSNDLVNILVTEEIRKLGGKAELKVTVSEDEYLHAKSFLEELQPYKRKGITVEDIRDGFTEIQLRVKDLDALEDFWKRYNSGELSNDLENILVTEESRKLGGKAELKVTVSEDEYLHARSFVEELQPYKRKDEEIEVDIEGDHEEAKEILKQPGQKKEEQPTVEETEMMPLPEEPGDTRPGDIQRVCFLLKDLLIPDVKSKQGLSNALLHKYSHLKDDEVHEILDWLKSLVLDLKNIEQKMFKFSDEFQEDESKDNIIVTPYRQLLVKLDLNLNDKDLERMKFLVADIIADGMLETIMTSLELFEALEHHGSLSLENLSTIQWILNSLPRKDLLYLLDGCSVTGSNKESYGLRLLPADYVQRKSDEEDLLKLLETGQPSVGVIDEKNKIDSSRPGTRSHDVVGVRGMGGIGKTVLVQAVCWQIKNHRQVIWLTMGQTPDILSLLNTLANVWSADAVSFSDVASAQNWIRSKSAEKDSLVVLDDVWNVNHASAFDILAGSCQLCLTSCDSNVVRGLRGSTLYNLGALKKKQARELLLKSAQKKMKELSQDVRIIVEEILEQCAGLPLALALIGSSLVDARHDNVVDWRDRLDGLKEADLEEIRSCFPKESYPYENLLAAIEVSFRSLTNEYREKFLDFAIFPEDSEIPSSVFEMLWGIPARKTRSILSFLERRSLIQNGTKAHCYVVHDMLLEYIRGRLIRERKDDSALLKAHRALLDKYRGRCEGEKWSNGPRNDLYFFRNLAFQLIGAEKECELEKELMDFSWLKVKLDVTDLASLLADFRYLSSDIQDKQEFKMLKSSLLLSSNVITAIKSQLSGQLLGRLKGYSENQKVKELLKQCSISSESTEPRLLPSRWCLTPPGGPLVRTTNGRSRTINAIVVTPDEKRIITGGADGTIRFWDYDTGKELEKIEAHSNMVYALVLSFRTNLLVSGSFDCTVKVWDMDTLEDLVTFDGHKDWISGVAIISSSQKVISSSYDHTIKLWDIKSGQLIHTLEGHKGNVRGIALFPNEQLLASASQDKTVKIWNLQTHKLKFTFCGHSDTVYAVTVCPDGKYVVSASEDTVLKIWDIEKGIEVRTLIGHTSDVFTVAVSPDGERVFSASDDTTVKIWSFNTGEELATLRGHSESVRVVAVSPKGHNIVSGSEDRTYKLWKVDLLKNVPNFLGHKQAINDLSISNDHRLCLTASADSLVKVWNCDQFEEISSLSGHEGPVLAVALHHKSRYAVSGGRDSTIRIWNLERCTEELCLKKHQHPVQALCFFENGKFFVSGGRDNSIGFWSWSDKTCIAWLSAPIFDITHITLTPQYLFIGNNQHVVCRYSVEQTKENSLAMISDKKDVQEPTQIVYTSMPRVDEEDLPVLSVLGPTVHVGPDSRVQPALLIKGGKMLLGSIMSCSPLSCLDVVSGIDVVHTIDPDGKSFVTALATLDDDKEVLVGTDQGQIVRLELDSDTILQVFQEENATTAVTAIAKSADEKRFVTGNVDGDLLLWCVDQENSRPLQTCKSKINGICALERDVFAACDESGHLYVFSVTGDASLSICAHNTPVLVIRSFQQTGYTTVATGAFEYLKLWIAKFNDDGKLVCEEKRQIFHPGFDVKAIAFLPNGDSFLTGSCDNIIRLWDTENGQILKTFQASSFGITYVSISDDKIVACFNDSFIATWSLKSGIPTGQNRQAHCGRYHVIQILPQSHDVISDGFHYTLKRWSLSCAATRFQEAQSLIYPHSNEVTASAVSPDERFLITGSRDKKLQMWLLESGECVSEFHLDHSALSIACCSNGRVCVGLSDGQICFFQMQI